MVFDNSGISHVLYYVIKIKIKCKEVHVLFRPCLTKRKLNLVENWTFSDVFLCLISNFIICSNGSVIKVVLNWFFYLVTV